MSCLRVLDLFPGVSPGLGLFPRETENFNLFCNVLEKI
jgi:hypothetical protein